MQVRTTSTTEVSIADLASGLIAAGPEAFGEFMLEVYRGMDKSRTFSLDKAAEVMAARHGNGRLQVFDALTQMIAYHQECARREDDAAKTSDD